ncbi:hypothetical protein O3M35_009845 [Rhynocoris fuscipes]|uniref:Uncharacterized protein n=1 Tax=Rhynocoris fuscipes TaxID=488301 RepID=A0AAW1D4G8_9HEMI
MESSSSVDQFKFNLHKPLKDYDNAISAVGSVLRLFGSFGSFKQLKLLFSKDCGGGRKHRKSNHLWETEEDLVVEEEEMVDTILYLKKPIRNRFN